MANEDINAYAKVAGIKLWEVAKELNITDRRRLLSNFLNFQCYIYMVYRTGNS